jgi:hypothetical protein
MTGDTRELLDVCMDERRRQLRLTWDQVATLAKIHRETLRQIRRRNSELRPLTKAGLEIALQWQPGSVDRILAGRGPLPLDQAPTQPRQPRHKVTGETVQERIMNDPKFRAEMARVITEAMARQDESAQESDDPGQSEAS